jgi:hypothetical protein
MLPEFFQALEKSARRFPSLGKLRGEIFQCLEKPAFSFSNAWKS